MSHISGLIYFLNIYATHLTNKVTLGEATLYISPYQPISNHDHITLFLIARIYLGNMFVSLKAGLVISK